MKNYFIKSLQQNKVILLLMFFKTISKGQIIIKKKMLYFYTSIHSIIALKPRPLERKHTTRWLKFICYYKSWAILNKSFIYVNFNVIFNFENIFWCLSNVSWVIYYHPLSIVSPFFVKQTNKQLEESHRVLSVWIFIKFWIILLPPITIT